MTREGIILSGGSGTRLYPITRAASKPPPLYGTPMGNNPLSALMLGDVAAEWRGTTVFGYQVQDPQRYGVAEIDSTGRVLSIVEKPVHPRSHYAVTGLYFYNNAVLAIAASLQPSARGEYVITDVNRAYLEREMLHLALISRGMAWLDTTRTTRCTTPPPSWPRSSVGRG